MSDSEKLDLILAKVEKNSKVLDKILNMIDKDSSTKGLLFSLGTDIVDDILFGSEKNDSDIYY